MSARTFTDEAGWTILGFYKTKTPYSYKYFMRCSCGRNAWVKKDDYRMGKSLRCRSCATRIKNYKYNYPLIKDRPQLYNLWKAMRQRCNNPNNRAFIYYGGLGIKVCERWNNFQNFYEDMHPSYEPGLTLDRTDYNEGYSPSNCRWATMKEQNSHRRKRFSIKPYERQA